MTSTANIPRQRSLIPDPFESFEAGQRFYHHDLGDLAPELMATESRLLQQWLDQAAWSTARPRLLQLVGDAWQTDQDWARERLQRLRAALSKRRSAA